MRRAEGKWESSVFKGPLNEQSKRAKLSRDKGRDALFGNSGEPDAYQRKTNLAAAISTKESTRPPQFNEDTAINRRTQELYGNSAYEPLGRENNRQFKPAQTGVNAEQNRDTKGQKAQNLSSNVFGDSETRPAATWNQTEKLVNPSMSWNSQATSAKIVNKGKVDPYKQKQNQLASGGGVFE